MLTRLPSAAGVPVILVSTGERATAIRCDDPAGFRIVLPPYPDGGEGGGIGGDAGDWIVTRADGCIFAVRTNGVVTVAEIEAANVARAAAVEAARLASIEADRVAAEAAAVVPDVSGEAAQ